MRPCLPAALVLALALGPGCGGDEARPDEAPAAAAGAGAPALDPAALLDPPTVGGLLQLLAQDHRRARRALGRHRLTYTADFTLTPGETPPPAVDAAIPSPQEVHDVLLLEWAGDDDRAPAIHLRQGPDEEGARAVIILGEEVYSRLPYRGWLRRELDSELHWRWLDDAERSVHDVLALAAPSLALRVEGEEDGVLRLGLARADAVDAALADPREAAGWRRGAVVTAIEGTLEIDREHGLWRRADLKVDYTLPDAEGRTLTGSARLVGERTLLPTLTIEPPATSAPLPERVRYEDERRRLLQGGPQR